jgi:hypothetical protein
MNSFILMLWGSGNNAMKPTLGAPLTSQKKKKRWDKYNYVNLGDTTGNILVPSPTGSHSNRGDKDKVNRQL